MTSKDSKPKAPLTRTEWAQQVPTEHKRQGTIGYPSGYAALRSADGMMELNGTLIDKRAKAQAAIREITCQLTPDEKRNVFTSMDEIKVLAPQQKSALQAHIATLREVANEAVSKQAHLHAVVEGNFDRNQLAQNLLAEALGVSPPTQKMTERAVAAAKQTTPVQRT